MPLNGPVGGLQLGLLLLIVPAQYLITTYFGATDVQREEQFKQVISFITSFKERYLSYEGWIKWVRGVWTRFIAMLRAVHARDGSRTGAINSQLDSDESPAKEVISYRNKIGYFADSLEPRNPRPSMVKYRIGQVVRHKRLGYRGVIIGWDATAKAPEHWLEKNHPADKPHWRTMPNYLILVDTRDRPKPLKTYVAEENLEIVVRTQIIHPDIDKYFEGFDSMQHLPRQRLKELYPHG